MASKSSKTKTEGDGLPADDLLRKLLAVNLYVAGANYGTIARIAGKRKRWVVATLKGLPDRRRQ